MIDQGVTAVLEVRSEAKDDAKALKRLGLNYSRLPLARDEAPLLPQLQETADWVLRALDVGDKVLIHCDDGRQRSAFIAAASLIALGFPLSAALDFMQRARPDAELSLEQSSALEIYDARRARPGRAA